MRKIFNEETIVSGGSASVAQGAAKGAKTNRVSMFNRVISSSRKLYENQVYQNADTKFRCINRSISKMGANSVEFWTEFNKRKSEILDRDSFKRRCSEEDLNPEIVAEHLIMEGNATVNKVLSEGFVSLDNTHRTFTQKIKAYKVEIMD